MKQLPYATEFLPTLISIFPGSQPEIIDFMGDRSPNAEMIEFVRNSFGHHYRNITRTDFLQEYKQPDEKGKIYLIGGINIPIPFLYLSNQYGSTFSFFRTEPRDKNKILDDLKSNKYFAVFKSDKSLNFEPRLFEGQPTKGNLLRMMDYVNFVHVHELFRYSF